MTTTTTLHSGIDAHGNPMTGDAEAIELYDRAIDQLLRYHPSVLDLVGELASRDPMVPMGAALVAYLHLMSTEAGDLATAREASAGLSATAGNERERHHAAAIQRWSNGDWTGAASALDDLLHRWPTDVLALMFGHQLDFFLGDNQNLRDRPVRSLREFDPSHPHIQFVRGMTAFGLEEAGHYEQALAAGLTAVEANSDDVWAIHAVVHSYEMQGLVAEGIQFLESDRTHWERDNLFTVHNWWHLGLYMLEAGRIDRVLDIYDTEVHHEGSAGVAIEMLDASAMLWRLYLDGVDTGGRFDALADAWVPKTTVEPWYVFNDLHAVMALVGADRLAEARSFIGGLEAWAAADQSWNASVSAQVGLPVCRSLVAFAESRHDDVVAELYPIRRTAHRFGGSHAQRDALQRTLLESALRSGQFELARALTAERLGVRESSVYSWTQRAKALRGLGDVDGAGRAEETAKRHRDRFAAA